MNCDAKDDVVRCACKEIMVFEYMSNAHCSACKQQVKGYMFKCETVECNVKFCSDCVTFGVKSQLYNTICTDGGLNQNTNY